MWRVDTYRLSPKFMGSRKPLRPSSFPRRIWRETEEEVRRRSRLGLCRGAFICEE